MEQPGVTLNNGCEIPQAGFGVYLSGITASARGPCEAEDAAVHVAGAEAAPAL